MAILETFAQVTASMNVMKTFGEAFVNVRDQTQLISLQLEYKQELSKLHDSIFQAKQDNMMLTDTIVELRKKVDELENQIRDTGNYSLAEFTAGSYCYVENGYVGSYEKTQKLCWNCFDAGVKSTLNQFYDEDLVFGWKCICIKCQQAWHFAQFNKTS